MFGVLQLNKSLNQNYTEGMLNKVPEITAFFWITKLLTTGMGEVFSDYLAHIFNPIVAGGLTLIGLVVSLVLQLKARKYVPWIYWLLVTMVSVFGTMAADVIHVVLNVPYVVSTTFFIVSLIVIFVLWYKSEKSLSIHSVYTSKREKFYWATVFATFALGTAAGDMTASTMHLGYFPSALLFTILLAIPAIGYWKFGFNEIFAFWFAYIMTRPVGASFSDWIGTSKAYGGLGIGKGPVSLVLTILIVIFVSYLTITRKDVKKDEAVA